MNKLIGFTSLRSIIRSNRLTTSTNSSSITKIFSNHSTNSQSRNRTLFTSTTPIPPSLELLSQSIPAMDPSFIPLLLAVLLAAGDEDEEEEEGSGSTNPPWTVKEFQDRGMGAVASRDLKRGELLISERPICIWGQGLNKESAQALFDQMSAKAQAVYMSLAKNEIPGLDEIRAIRATNGFAVQLPPTPEDKSSKVVAMVFPKISRLNHACNATASQAFNFQTLRMEVYTIAPIPSNSEIFIEYIPNLITQTRSERQQSLKSAFGFPTCLCSVCSGSKEEIAASDKRRTEIKLIGNSLRDGRNDRKVTLARMERIRVLLKEENYRGLPEFEDSALSDAYAVYVTLKARAEAEGKL